MPVDQKIIDKVQKLLNLADKDKNDSEHQAMAAMEAARRLMKQHGIEMADLKESQGTDWDIEVWSSEIKSQFDTYAQVLAYATGKLFDCEYWMVRFGRRYKYKVQMCFAGESTDVALAARVWPWLMNTAVLMAKRRFGPTWAPQHRNFAEGFADRVIMRVDELSKANDDPGDQKYALVLLDKENATRNFMERHNINIREVKPRKVKAEIDFLAYALGAKAGSEIDLNFRKQVEGKDQSKHLK